MAINILTTDDLQKFKEELFVELRQTLGKQTKQDPTKQREWLRTKEVCRLIGISLSKLQYMRDNDEINLPELAAHCFIAQMRLINSYHLAMIIKKPVKKWKQIISFT
jgi:hypothetical protein